MTRDETVTEMVKAYVETPTTCAAGMEAALDVAIRELLGEPDATEVAAFRTKFPRMPDPVGATFACYVGFRRAHYSAKPDPAIEAVKRIAVFNGANGIVIGDETAARIVAAVRKADKEAKGESR